MENYKLYALRNDILTLIGQYGVTPAEGYFILKDITNDMESIYLKQVDKEIEDEKQRQADENKENEIKEIKIGITNPDGSVDYPD